jgi:tripartite ATP-independent transporter DctP family solute receptor
MTGTNARFPEEPPVTPQSPAPLARRTLLAGAAALPLVAIRTRPARAAEFSYKFANNVAPTHPLAIRAQEAADRIVNATSGRVEIKIFPNSQLGSDTDTLSQLRAGAVEFFTLSGLILSTLVPVAAINGVGFAFKDYAQVWQAMDGPLGAMVRAEITKRGLIPFEKIWDNGYRQMTSSSKPIKGPEDLAGFKMRVPPSPLWTGMFKAFGASPTSINFNEVYSALQTHIVDGQENPLAIIDSGKLYEVQKYLAVTNHMWDGYWLLANRRAFSALPEDAQEIVQREFNASALAEREDVARLNATLQGSLQARGLNFVQTDPAAFRAALRKAGFYNEWREKFGAPAWSTLEGTAGSLA